MNAADPVDGDDDDVAVPPALLELYEALEWLEGGDIGNDPA